jgi:hypothetical protein
MKILIFKLLEIFQYVFLSFFISLFVADYLNKYLFPLLIKSTDYIYVKVTFYLFILSSVYYFINRYVTQIPFILRFHSKYVGYIPSLKKENIRGSQLGLGFIFFAQQDNFKNLVNLLFNK